MERISKNCFDMLKISKDRFKDKWVRGFLAAMVFLAPFFLTIIIPTIIGLVIGDIEIYSVIQSVFAVIGMFLFGPLCVGYAKYNRELQAGNQPSIKVVFDADNFKSKSLFLHMAVGLIISAIYLFGFVLFIVPAFIFIAYFSMVFFFMSSHKYMGISEAMKACGKSMRGNTAGMFAYKVLFYFMYAIILVGAVLGGVGLVSYHATNPIAAILLAVVLLLVVFILISLVVMFNQACNTVYFGEILDYIEKKQARKRGEKAEEKETVEEVKAEEKVEETNEQPAEEKPAKKSTKKANTEE